MPGSVVGERLIGRWTVPLRGTLHGLPPYAVPEDAVYDSLNVLVREGALVTRSGLVKLNAIPLDGRPIGAITILLLASGAFQEDAFQNDFVQIVANTPRSAILVVTPTSIFVYLSGAWHNITGTVLTGHTDDFARLTAIQIGQSISVVITNGIDRPRVWDSTTATVTPLDGPPPAPLWTDVVTASDRIVGIIPPYTVQWGNPIDLSTWPANNFRNLSDTIDKVVAIRNLGTLGVVVYKQRSIWIGQPGGTTNASYFTFSLRGFWDGPASAYAVADADGAQFYMTDLGRIGYFDGSTQQWVGDGVWPLVRDELDRDFAFRISSTFDPRNHEVTFYYPIIGDGGLCKGTVTVLLPLPDEGRKDIVAFRGRLGVAVSVGADTRLLDDRKAMVFGDETHLGYFVDGLNDDGIEFPGFWQEGFITAPAFDTHRLEGFEVFCERGSGFGSLMAKIVTNSLLENPDTAEAVQARTIDLSLTPPTQQEGGDATGKFFGLRFEFITPVHLRWYAARLAARRIEPHVPLERMR